MSLVGETLGNYSIEGLLGHGTMAEVYLARHLIHGYEVAIKVIHPHLLNDPGFIERFKREAKVLGEMDHPHIIHVYDFVITPQTAYIVMEYLGGGTLADKINKYHEKKETMPLWEVLQVLEPIASAIDYAHEHGLVHRDIKPANILFRDNQDAVLSDFGLAFLINDPRLSASNTITGTPAYLSPEQAKGMAGDARSDVYALGIVLYEMLTGYTPFQGNIISVVMKHISDAPPSLRSFGRYLPKKVEDVVMKALDKQPHLRYQSAQFFARDFRKSIEKTLPEVMLLPASEEIIQPQPPKEQQIELATASEMSTESLSESSEAISETVVDAGNIEPPAMGQAEDLKEAARETLQFPAEELQAGSAAEQEIQTTAAASSLEASQRRASSVLPAYRAAAASGKRTSGGRVWSSLLIVLAVFLGVMAFLFFVLPQLINPQQGVQNNPAAGPAKYNVGQFLEVRVPGGASTSVYSGCRTLFGGNVVGVASDGQKAQITGRITCGKQWYYQVYIKDAVSENWNGTGYIPEDFLK